MGVEIQSNNYTYFGCYNSLSEIPSSNPDRQALPSQQITGPRGNGLLYSVSDCSAAALSKNATAFGMQNQQLYEGEPMGNCFLSELEIPSDAINSAVLYGSPDNSLNMCATDGIGKNLVNAVYANKSAINFFSDQSIGQNIHESTQTYILAINALTVRFENVMNQIDTAFLNTNPDVYEAAVKSHMNESMIIIKEMMVLKLGLEKTCEGINQNIEYVNSKIKYTDDKKTLAELKLDRLYGSDNAASGWLADSKDLTIIMNIENISLVAIAILYIIFYYSFNKTHI
jgi:hypothetical protein